MSSEAERLLRVQLSFLTEPGHPSLTGLAHELGARRLLDELVSRGEESPELAARIAAVDPARELERAERLGLRFAIPGDDEWPGTLAQLAGAGTAMERGGVPLGLWVAGPLRLDQCEDGIAVVGSRSATTYGERVAGEIAAGAALAQRVVVSGAAFGIDQAAHRGARDARTDGGRAGLWRGSFLSDRPPRPARTSTSRRRRRV